MTVLVLLAFGLAAFADGLMAGSVPLQALGTICLAGGIMIFFIKVAEEIHPVTVKWSIEGEVGEVVSRVSREAGGIVRIRSELWSAKSEGPKAPGEKVRVVRTEGLLAWVSKA